MEALNKLREGVQARRASAPPLGLLPNKGQAVSGKSINDGVLGARAELNGGFNDDILKTLGKQQ